jgi:hypothetical protein
MFGCIVRTSKMATVATESFRRQKAQRRDLGKVRTVRRLRRWPWRNPWWIEPWKLVTHGMFFLDIMGYTIWIYDVAVATNGNMSQPTKIYGRVGLAMVWCWWFDAQSGHLLVFDVSQAKGGGRGKGRPKNEAPPHRPYEVSSGCVQRLLSHDYVNHMLSMTNWDLYYQ